MKIKWLRFLAIATSLLLINIATCLTTSANQALGIYPIDADSIGVPIVLTLAASLMIFPFLFGICIVHGKDSCDGLTKKYRLKTISLVLCYGMGAIFSISGFVYWNIEYHRYISFSYLILFLILSASVARNILNRC